MTTSKVKSRTGTSGLLYLRVSSKGQVETEVDPEGMSLPAQRRKCQAKAQENRLSIVDELVDSGITATSIDQRASYQALIERVRTDESISFVMVYALSRLHRNWAEAGLMVMQLRNYGVRLLSATENIDDSTPEGQMMLGVIFSVSGFQSAASSCETAASISEVTIVFINFKKAERYLGRGGKRSATPLWIVFETRYKSAVVASLCRRTPK